MQPCVCLNCGYVYNPEEGGPANGIAPNTPFEDLPDGWVCSAYCLFRDLFYKEEQQKNTAAGQGAFTDIERECMLKPVYSQEEVMQQTEALSRSSRAEAVIEIWFDIEREEYPALYAMLCDLDPEGLEHFLVQLALSQAKQIVGDRLGELKCREDSAVIEDADDERIVFSAVIKGGALR